MAPALFSLFLLLQVRRVPGYEGIEEKLPVAVAPQPIPFSHKQHTSVGIKCTDCHIKAITEERAGLPVASQCMLCHAGLKKESPAIQRLARFGVEGKPVPWVRVYRVPDFVFFSHASHGKAKIDCQTCHGPVAEREVLQKEVSTGMRTCLACHRSRKVSTDCSLCHELGQ